VEKFVQPDAGLDPKLQLRIACNQIRTARYRGVDLRPQANEWLTEMVVKHPFLAVTMLTEF
jgi:hypothetical protein